jgi:hypothetical protein
LPWPVLSFNINQPCSTNKTVISTEAAHGIIVSSAVEKSASLPPPFANPHRAPAEFLQERFKSADQAPAAKLRDSYRGPHPLGRVAHEKQRRFSI